MEQNALERFPWNKYMSDLFPLCEMKADDFHLLGYTEVTASEVLECVRSMLKDHGQLHHVVAAIMGLNIGQFMNYMTMNAYRGKLDDSFV